MITFLTLLAAVFAQLAALSFAAAVGAGSEIRNVEGESREAHRTALRMATILACACATVSIALALMV